jgi:hypothetical protein
VIRRIKAGQAQERVARNDVVPRSLVDELCIFERVAFSSWYNRYKRGNYVYNMYMYMCMYMCMYM